MISNEKMNMKEKIIISYKENVIISFSVKVSDKVFKFDIKKIWS